MIIMGVDPGTSHMGIVICRADPDKPGVMEVLKRYHIQGIKLCREKQHLFKQFSDQLNILLVYQALFIDLMMEWKPDYIVSESAFSYAARPAAFGSLTRVILMLEIASFKTVKKIVNTVAPQFVKKAWTGSGDKSVQKDQMRAQYYAAQNVTGDLDKEAASEHEIDAVAHTFAWLCRDIWFTVKQDIKPKKKKRLKAVIHT